MRALLKRLIVWALADGVVNDETLTYDAVELDAIHRDTL